MPVDHDNIILRIATPDLGYLRIPLSNVQLYNDKQVVTKHGLAVNLHPGQAERIDLFLKDSLHGGRFRDIWPDEPFPPSPPPATVQLPVDLGVALTNPSPSGDDSETSDVSGGVVYSQIEELQTPPEEYPDPARQEQDAPSEFEAGI